MQIVLPADVYDTLEFSALAFGGIGAGALAYSGDERLGSYFLLCGDAVPCCIHGHGISAEDRSYGGEIRAALWVAGIDYTTNDDALGTDERITFEEWCKRLNVIRGL